MSSTLASALVSPGDAAILPAGEDFRRYGVIRRDGAKAPFLPEKIETAILKAFLAAQDASGKPTARNREAAAVFTRQVVDSLLRRRPHGGEFHIEEIQDQVELALMRAGEHIVARRYVLYREERARLRSAKAEPPSPSSPSLRVRLPNGSLQPLDTEAFRESIAAACENLPFVAADEIFRDALSGLYDEIPQAEAETAAILAARARIESQPEYTFVAARLLSALIAQEILGEDLRDGSASSPYVDRFERYVRLGTAAGRLDPALAEFDLGRMSRALRPERDRQFAYMGLQTLYDRYLLHIEGRRIEMPQWFWMRIAMGLALREPDREERAVEFYEAMSQFRFVPSTPTLFNSGTRYPQLSSCYLTTIGDDLGEIFDAIRDNALLSKFSGGLGNDWTPVRALGAPIRSTNGKSQGIVPFLKVANDTAVAVNQGGKRQGAVCAYLEPWHLDVEEFLDLRKNTGDDRRRTHDMHTALWIPDLFMERVRDGGAWTLFSPDAVPDLHDLYGAAFAERYRHYETLAVAGELSLSRSLPARDLWRLILTRLYETGHPWITFKDPSNLRSPQRHAGVVHSSNLCTEILLNSSREEIAVCNLGSVNLAAHVSPDGPDESALAVTVRTAMRMLDNVIDLNFYAAPEARKANLRHRPAGLGLMGYQDALHLQKIPLASEEAVAFADRSMEIVSYHAILASSELAAERGPYASYRGSLWDQGLLPIDTLDLMEEARSGEMDLDRSSTLDWTPARESVRRYGMRNSHCLAIAPTATISNIAGVSASIEPAFSNLYVKSNLSGEFTVINPFLVQDLRERGLWDRDLLDDLKYYDGVPANVLRIPDDLKRLYATAFEIDPVWLIRAASRRQKWIDMGQSLNLYVAAPSGKDLSDLYFLAWNAGLKTTYYLRTKGATQVEKSTLDINRRAIQPLWMRSESPSARLSPASSEELPSPGANGSAACGLDAESCEACQ
jgi:ribonucleoside-diphosphate reductase alpha chain